MSEDFRRRELRRLGAHALLNDGHILPLDRANEGIFDGFCDEVIAYFKRHDIKWWNSGQEAAARKLTRSAPQGWPQVDDWIHVHVIPKDHSRLRRHVPRGVGAYAGQTTLESAWRAFLKEPGRYRMIDPSELIPQSVENRWLEWREWLSARYGT